MSLMNHCKLAIKTGGLFALIASFLLSSCHKKKEANAPAAIPVIARMAISNPVPLYIETVGHMEAYNTVDIMAQADGILIKTHFEDGADVKQGDILYSIDPSPYLAELQLAKGKLKQQLAEFSYSQRNAERNAPLVEDDYISKDDFDSIETTVVADNALVEQMLADVKTAEINLSYTEIYSPIDARAGFSLVDDGNLILEEAKTTLVALNQITPIYATFFIPGKQFPLLNHYQKQAGPLKTLITLDSPHAPSYEGNLTFIDNSIDLATGMIQLKATFPNESKELWPNQYVKVKLILDTIEDAVLIPMSAVQTSAKGKFAFVVRGNNTVKSVPIVLGQRQPGDWIVVNQGIRAGDRVVTDGHVNLYDGAKVSVSDHQRVAQ
ncbi:MAG: efflux RND transporter periplasmic adaptor subunit [Chlamydiota bacterium]